MSWDQSYSILSVESLLEKLTGRTSLDLLKDELLLKQGINVDKIEEVVLVDGMYGDEKGFKITLSDGRVFIPKLVEQFTSDGNYGNDIYEYFLEGENPIVQCVDADTSNPLVDVYTIPDGYGDDLIGEAENDGG